MPQITSKLKYKTNIIWEVTKFKLQIKKVKIHKYNRKQMWTSWLLTSLTVKRNKY